MGYVHRMETQKIQISDKQQQFIDALQFEVLFGGAAGGGKSYAQLIDAYLYAINHAGSKQIMFRKSFPELKRSLILVSIGLFSAETCKYNGTDYKWNFNNGSSIEFGYLDSDADVQKYQSAEYDVVRFDELTHFTEWQYRYMVSRVRGANDFPKAVKSSTNPGGVGHSWVKARFIDVSPPVTEYTDELGQTRIFIPALVQDNIFLMEKDPTYVNRLQMLDENTRKALLYGEWELFEGVYFTEFNRDKHVINPIPIPDNWTKYFTMDYGLDMFAGLWIAENDGEIYIYREIYKPNLIISEAVKELKEVECEPIYTRYAPPDLWNRRQETGTSAIEIFQKDGLYFNKSSADRVDGWLSLKELLNTGHFHIFSNCVNLIRTLPSLQISSKNPSDVATQPHELTHLPDALRGYSIMHRGGRIGIPKQNPYTSFINFGR
jgi:phage terminase large subunit